MFGVRWSDVLNGMKRRSLTGISRTKTHVGVARPDAYHGLNRKTSNKKTCNACMLVTDLLQIEVPTLNDSC